MVGAEQEKEKRARKGSQVQLKKKRKRLLSVCVCQGEWTAGQEKAVTLSPSPRRRFSCFACECTALVPQSLVILPSSTAVLARTHTEACWGRGKDKKGVHVCDPRRRARGERGHKATGMQTLETRVGSCITRRESEGLQGARSMQCWPRWEGGVGVGS